MKTVELARHGTSVAYDDVGTGLPVVLLHAFPFDREMWSEQLGPLSAAGFRVLTPDLPGFGQSSPSRETFTIELAADVVAEFLDALKVEKAVIGGLSMGGYVAMAFARKHATKLTALILADTRAAPDDEAGRENRNKMIDLVKAEGAAKVGAAMAEKVVGEKAKNTPAIFDRVKTIATRQPDAGVITALAALRDRSDAEPGLKDVAVPTLIIVGEHDTVTPPLAAARMAGMVPHCELVSIPDAGHLSNLENPSAFNAAVLKLLRKVA